VEALEPRRLFAAGELDPTFGLNGVATVDTGSVTPVLFELFTLPDGKLLAVGGSSSHALEMVRLTADGALHPTIGNGGVAFGARKVKFSRCHSAGR